MTIQDDDGCKLRTLIAAIPMALPHYCDDLNTQRRVGMAISAYRQSPDFRVRTIWL
jgi:hypothetical protein